MVRSPSRIALWLSSWRPFLAGVALGLALLAAIGAAIAQPIDAAPFDALLKANVRNGAVNYPGFQDSAAFRAYLEALAKSGRPSSKSDQLAQSINAYNAFAIAGILEGLSPSTFLGRQRFFKVKEWPFEGRSTTLQALENDVLRKADEPRIHFAIACASQSCPRLRSEAYVAARLDAQLDEQARLFVNDPARNRFDKAARTAHLSEIFHWFDGDFIAAAGSTQKFIARYVADPEVARGLSMDAYKVESIPYDWDLNGVPPRG
jgi:hypothetical protein